MKKFGRTAKILLVLPFLILVWILVAPLIAEYLIVEKPLEKADVIFVLGGSATYLERTDKAAELFKKGITKKILLTDDGTRGGWSQAEQRNMPFVELARRNLTAQGVPAESIETIKPETTGTIYEARALTELSKKENLQTILLVTSAYHTRRALRTFEGEFAKENLQAEMGIEFAKTGSPTPAPSVWWFSVFGWQSVAGEYVKSAYYWVYY